MAISCGHPLPKCLLDGCTVVRYKSFRFDIRTVSFVTSLKVLTAFSDVVRVMADLCKGARGGWRPRVRHPSLRSVVLGD